MRSPLSLTHVVMAMGGFFYLAEKSWYRKWFRKVK